MTPEKAAISYDYTNPLLMLALLGAAALVLGILLKAVDKKKHLGLEEPNIKAWFYQCKHIASLSFTKIGSHLTYTFCTYEGYDGWIS